MSLIQLIYRWVKRIFWGKYIHIFLFFQIPLFILFILTIYTSRSSILLSDLQLIYFSIAGFWVSIGLKLIYDFKWKIEDFNEINKDNCKNHNYCQIQSGIECNVQAKKEWWYYLFVFLWVGLCVASYFVYYDRVFTFWFFLKYSIMIYVWIVAFLTSIGFIWIFIIIRFILQLKSIDIIFFHPDGISWTTPIVNLLNITTFYYGSWILFLPLILSLVTSQDKLFGNMLIGIYVITLIITFILSVFKIYTISLKEKNRKLMIYVHEINTMVEQWVDVELISKKIEFYNKYLQKQNVFPFNVEAFVPLFTTSFIPTLIPHILELLNKIWK